ncbi:hypothetical protein HYQ46_012467 [Verticillium longisporum]|nr:hypothetical protein HYQ46_012467 [Verticillium longisporum]
MEAQVGKGLGDVGGTAAWPDFCGFNAGGEAAGAKGKDFFFGHGSDVGLGGGGGGGQFGVDLVNVTGESVGIIGRVEADDGLVGQLRHGATEDTRHGLVVFEAWVAKVFHPVE